MPPAAPPGTPASFSASDPAIRLSRAIPSAVAALTLDCDMPSASAVSATDIPSRCRSTTALRWRGVSRPSSVFVVFMGFVTVVAVSAVLARVAGTGPVAALGRRSMEIYLGHILVGSLTRAGLVELGVTDGLVHLVLGTITGVLVPVLVWWVATRVGAGWLFALPKGVERRPPAAPSTCV